PLDKEDAAIKLFPYITKAVPNVKIVALVEIHETPWTEEHLQSVVAGAHFERILQDHPEAKEDVHRMITANIEGLRREHSGTNIFKVCEWIGPRLYRKDMLAFNDPITNSFKAGNDVKYTWCNVYDRDFSDFVSWRANPPGLSAV